MIEFFEIKNNYKLINHSIDEFCGKYSLIVSKLFVFNENCFLLHKNIAQYVLIASRIYLCSCILWHVFLALIT